MRFSEIRSANIFIKLSSQLVHVCSLPSHFEQERRFSHEQMQITGGRGGVVVTGGAVGPSLHFRYIIPCCCFITSDVFCLLILVLDILRLFL